MVRKQRGRACTKHIPANEISLGGIKAGGHDDQVWLKLVGDREDHVVECGEILSVAGRTMRPPNVDIEPSASIPPSVQGVSARAGVEVPPARHHQTSKSVSTSTGIKLYH